MQSPPLPRNLVPPRSKYSPQHHILKHPQLPFLPQCQRPGFTPIQNNRQNYSSIYPKLEKQIYISLHILVPYSSTRPECLFCSVPDHIKCSVGLGFVVDKVSLWQIWLPVRRLPSASIIPPMLRIHLHLLLLLAKVTSCQCWGPCKQQCSVRTGGTLDNNLVSHFFKYVDRSVWCSGRTAIGLAGCCGCLETR